MRAGLRNMVFLLVIAIVMASEFYAFASFRLV